MQYVSWLQKQSIRVNCSAGSIEVKEIQKIETNFDLRRMMDVSQSIHLDYLKESYVILRLNL